MLKRFFSYFLNVFTFYEYLYILTFINICNRNCNRNCNCKVINSFFYIYSLSPFTKCLNNPFKAFK